MVLGNSGRLIAAIAAVGIASAGVAAPTIAEAAPLAHLEQQGSALEPRPTPTTTTELAVESGQVTQIQLHSDVAIVGVSWTDDVAPPAAVDVRTQTAGDWGDWAPLHMDIDGAESEPGEAPNATSPMAITDAQLIEVRLESSDTGSPAQYTVMVIDPRGEDGAEETSRVPAVENQEQPATGQHSAHASPLEAAVPEGLASAEADELPLGEPEPQRLHAPEDAGLASEELQQPATPADRQETAAQPLGAVQPDGTPRADVNPREGETLQQPQPERLVTTQSAPAPQARSAASQVFDTGADFGLKINRRSAWGANEALRDKVPDPKVQYRGAVVHHTTGTNNYSRSQVPSLIRGFYHYHLSVGFGDVGYQFLVDRFGGVWEGRYASLVDPIQASQAKGANDRTFGVSVIGDWGTQAPPAAAQNAVARTITWMFEKWGVSNPKGTLYVPGHDYAGRSVPVISGHRQIGGTVCPGEAFFAQLGGIREQVNRYMYPPLKGGVVRQSGDDRYGSAAAAALASFPRGSETLYIANGLDYPDALAGGAVAGADGAPLLLTDPRRIPAATSAAIKKLKPQRIVILGREGAVSVAVERSLRGHAATVTRFGGADRFGTAAKIALAKTTTGGTVYLASGLDFPDALAGGPTAAVAGGPLLLTRPTALPKETVDALKQLSPSKIVVLGGDAVVSPKLAAQLRNYAPQVERLSGADRYATSAAIARSAFPKGAPVVYIAAGSSFADALAAGPVAAKAQGPVLLVTQGGVPQDTAAALRALKPTRIVIVGGPAAVSQGVMRTLDGLIAR